MTGNNCVLVNNSGAKNAAGPWGNSEGNCATPNLLYNSAINFMKIEVEWSMRIIVTSSTLKKKKKRPTRPKQAPNTSLVYFTGDFAEAGASYPCHGPSTPGTESQRQITDIINWDYAALRTQFPNAKIMGYMVFIC